MKFRGEFEKSGIDEFDDMCETIRDSMERSKLTANWMVEQLRKQGIKVDNTALSMILHGHRCGPVPIKIVRVSYAIICSYERWAAEVATHDFDKEAPSLF